MFPPADLAAIDPSYDVEEYVPKGVSLDWLREMEKAPPVERVRTVTGTADARVTTWESHRRTIAVDATEASTLGIRTFAFPEWRAKIDGTPKAIRAEGTTGAILLDVPAGAHTIDLQFGRTALIWAGWITTLLAVAACVGLAQRRWISIPFPGSSSGTRT